MEVLLNTQFLAAMKDLKTQDSELLTTIGLSDLLGDVMYFGRLPCKRFSLNQDLIDSLAGIEPNTLNREIGRRIMVDPKGWCLDAPEEVQKGALFYANMSTLFGPSSAETIFRYHVIRDNVGAIQDLLGISSRVSDRTVTLFDKSVTIADFDCQLIANESDKLQKQSDARKLCDFFITQMTGNPDYEIVEELEDGEEFRPMSIGEIFAATQNTAEASLFSESRDWTTDDRFGRWTAIPCDRCPNTNPDEVTLHVKTKGEVSRTFQASHLDPARRPWLTK